MAFKRSLQLVESRTYHGGGGYGSFFGQSLKLIFFLQNSLDLTSPNVLIGTQLMLHMSRHVTIIIYTFQIRRLFVEM